jgi:parallel beta-helix repeat protein
MVKKKAKNNFRRNISEFSVNKKLYISLIVSCVVIILLFILFLNLRSGNTIAGEAFYLPPADSCIDSDGGLNLEVLGTATATYSDGSVIDMTDGCRSEEILEEFDCVDENRLMGVFANCSRDGLVCINGECVNGCTNINSNGYCESEDVDNDWINVMDYGAIGDGVNDDSQAIQDAVDAAADNVLFFPEGRYSVTQSININSPLEIKSDQAIISFDFSPSPSQGFLFDITSNDVVVDGLTFDGTNLVFLEDTNNRYAIMVNGGESVDIKNCKFTNLNSKGYEDHTLKVTHAIYLSSSHNSVIQNNLFDLISGSAIFVADSDYTLIQFNDISNTGWYSIHYDRNSNNADIIGNRIVGEESGIRYYGGSINIMSQVPHPTNNMIKIFDNYISGIHSYGAAIRVLSTSNVIIENNFLENVRQEDSFVSYISVSARNGQLIDDVWTNNGPFEKILIKKNTLIAGDVGNVGIYVNNMQLGDDLPLGYSEDVIITDNKITSLDKDNQYYDHAIFIHSNTGGLKNVEISNNYVSGLPGSSNPLGGLIGLIGLAAFDDGKDLTEVLIKDNDVEYFDVPPESNGSKVGIYVGQYSNNVEVKGNNIKNFSYGVRLDSNAGPDIYGVNDNNFFGNIVNILTGGNVIIDDLDVIEIPLWDLSWICNQNDLCESELAETSEYCPNEC